MYVTLFSALFVGLIVGALGRLAVPGKQNIPIWLTIVIGIVAARPIVNTDHFSFITLLIQVALAAVGVIAVVALRGRTSVR
jgi:uncharacterized membrane protein YeaQ/YmgE (transglycosylase-associated protein family)